MSITDEHVQAVARALRKRWGPCEDFECDDETGMCHVLMVREVLQQSETQRIAEPSAALEAAQAQAWEIACAYGELLPPDAVSGLTPHMGLNRAHLATIIARVAPLLSGMPEPAEPR